MVQIERSATTTTLTPGRSGAAASARADAAKVDVVREPILEAVDPARHQPLGVGGAGVEAPLAHRLVVSDHARGREDDLAAARAHLEAEVDVLVAVDVALVEAAHGAEDLGRAPACRRRSPRRSSRRWCTDAAGCRESNVERHDRAAGIA